MKEMPFWGQEKYNGNLTISQFNPLWGLVDGGQLQHFQDLVETVQSESFFLPAIIEDGYHIRYGDSNVRSSTEI